MKGLYAIYRKIDHYDENLAPSQRQFFPLRYEERTMEKFLPVVPVIYEILRDSAERYKRTEQFQAFWFTCRQYLKKIDYEDRSFMCEEDLFHRQSFNYWRREFQDKPEGLETMMLWFKACFGIIGNEDYCCVQEFPTRTFDWNRMWECYRALDVEPIAPYAGLPPVAGKPEWSDEHQKLIRDRIERYRKIDSVNEEEAHRFLEEIREKNREKGIFQ